MKILHTADWHLGAKTNGKDRLPEQRRVLEEIESIVNFENIDVVIIAGDVFNTSSPSAEAEELFFETIKNLSNGGERFIFVLAGNHDDPTRLSAGLPLAGKHNIALVSDLKKLSKSLFVGGGRAKVIETGDGFVRVQVDGEIMTLAYLPYPSESRLGGKFDEDTSYSQKVKTWSSIGASAFEPGTLNVFVSHLFLIGSKVSDSEKRVGNILAVSESDLPVADYTALGHIHHSQKIGENVFYSGAITALSVNERGLSVELVETENSKVKDVRRIKLSNVSKYETVKAKSLEDAEAKLESFDDGDLVELVITQSEPLSASWVKEAKKKHPCLSTISLVLTQSGETKIPSKSRKLLSDEELFKQFYLKVKGAEPSAELVSLFLDCKGGLDEADNS